MNKLMTFAVALMAVAGAFADLSYAFVNTTGAKDETTTGYPERYTGYLCTQAAAEALFGGNKTAADITGYLAENYVDYASGMEKMDFYGYDMGEYMGEYSFRKPYQPGTLTDDGTYIAVVAYAGGEGEDDMFRVFESMASGGVLEFDPVYGSGTAGAWTQSAVPEPTSGLLLLLGLAGLALKRKRA